MNDNVRRLLEGLTALLEDAAALLRDYLPDQDTASAAATSISPKEAVERARRAYGRLGERQTKAVEVHGAAHPDRLTEAVIHTRIAELGHEDAAVAQQSTNQTLRRLLALGIVWRDERFKPYRFGLGLRLFE